MSRPLTVTIPHSLGRAEAVRRLQGGLGQIRTSLRGLAASVEDRWTGDRLDFRIGVLGQSITGWIDVYDDTVKIEVVLPSLLARLAERLRPRIEQEGTKMLEKK